MVSHSPTRRQGEAGLPEKFFEASGASQGLAMKTTSQIPQLRMYRGAPVPASVSTHTGPSVSVTNDPTHDATLRKKSRAQVLNSIRAVVGEIGVRHG